MTDIDGHAEGAGGISNHRSREEGLIVYLVYSRRSCGLSIGVNLYPDRKRCNLDCRYCEVFPFGTEVGFSLAAMESGLRKAIARAKERGADIRDICFSGNGEPTISPHFAEALDAALAVRDSEVPGAELVVISNGAGLLRDGCFAHLEERVRPPASVRAWLKLDAGSADWYRRLNGGSDDEFARLTAAIRRFAGQSECTLQTMHCSVDGAAPDADELQAWATLAAQIAGSGNVRLVQIYGKARPSPHDPACQSLPLASLEERKRILEAAFKDAGLPAPPIEVFE
jgi:histidinol dehydrogenase